MKVMVIGFQALHALKAAAEKLGDGNAEGVLDQVGRLLGSLDSFYHEIEADKDNMAAAEAGAHAASALAAQRKLQAQQLDRHTGGHVSDAAQAARDATAAELARNPPAPAEPAPHENDGGHKSRAKAHA